jgi:hypothetical protein
MHEAAKKKQTVVAGGQGRVFPGVDSSIDDMIIIVQILLLLRCSMKFFLNRGNN